MTQVRNGTSFVLPTDVKTVHESIWKMMARSYISLSAMP